MTESKLSRQRLERAAAVAGIAQAELLEEIVACYLCDPQTDRGWAARERRRGGIVRAVRERQESDA